MSILEDLIKGLGLAGSKKSRRSSGPLGLPPLPDPSEIQESVEKLVEGASMIKEIPRSLSERVTEASEDFQTADNALRGSRVRTGRKRK